MRRTAKTLKPMAGALQRSAAAELSSAPAARGNPRTALQRQRLRRIFGGAAQLREQEGEAVQLRAEDPHERGGDSPQVHHIIAHSKLAGGMDQLAAQDQAEVKRAFMPALGSLTIRQLLNINDRLTVTTTDPGVAVDDRSVKKDGIYESMKWIDAPLDALNDAQITLHNPAVGFARTTLAAWKASYNLVKLGQAPAVGDNDEFWAPLQNSYAEWAGGNLFYGAQSRVEPGGSDLDAFDSDAKYFRDPGHVARLQALAARLASAATPQDVKAVMLEIGAATKDAGAGPKNDRAKWFSAKNVDQKAKILSLMEPGPRKDWVGAQDKYSVLPLDYVLERVEVAAQAYAAARPSGSQVHGALAYLQQNFDAPVIDLLAFDRSKAKSGTRIFVGAEGIADTLVTDVPRKNMDSMRAVLKEVLAEAFAVKLKKELGI